MSNKFDDKRIHNILIPKQENQMKKKYKQRNKTKKKTQKNEK